MAATKPPKKGKTIAPRLLKAPSSDVPNVNVAVRGGAARANAIGDGVAKVDGVTGGVPRANAIGDGVAKVDGVRGSAARANANRGGAPREASVSAAAGMTGHQYRDLIASYIHHNYASEGLDVYVEISLGKTIIGKDRYIDVFVVRPDDRKALAIECKYQDSLGTVDEKIPYALQDIEALLVPGCLVYAGRGWSKGVLHSLEASRFAAQCLPDAVTLTPSRLTRELDHVLAAIFGLWDLVLPANKRFPPRGPFGG